MSRVPFRFSERNGPGPACGHYELVYRNVTMTIPSSIARLNRSSLCSISPSMILSFEVPIRKLSLRPPFATLYHAAAVPDTRRLIRLLGEM